MLDKLKVRSGCSSIDDSDKFEGVEMNGTQKLRYLREVKVCVRESRSAKMSEAGQYKYTEVDMSKD